MNRIVHCILCLQFSNKDEQLQEQIYMDGNYDANAKEKERQRERERKVIYTFFFSIRCNFALSFILQSEF